MNKLLTSSVEELIENDYLSEMKRNNLRKVIFINRRQKEMPSMKRFIYDIQSMRKYYDNEMGVTTQSEVQSGIYWHSWHKTNLKELRKSECTLIRREKKAKSERQRSNRFESHRLQDKWIIIFL